MGSVRTLFSPPACELCRFVDLANCQVQSACRIDEAGNRGGELPVLDVMCVVGILALGAIVALIGRGVEKL